jgi:putative membrane protein
MDSISYVFLAYASYSVAMLAVSPLMRSGGMLYLLETKKLRGSLYTRLLGALFFVYLDIIIDPVALRGNRWFLGQIYGYPEEGVYFGIPISNFIGWFVVGFVLIYALQKIDSLLRAENAKDRFGHRYPWRFLIGPALYLGVVIFNSSVTFLIREYNIAWSSIFIILLPSFLLYTLIGTKLSAANFPSTALEAHLRDFPGVMVPEHLRRQDI